MPVARKRQKNPPANPPLTTDEDELEAAHISAREFRKSIATLSRGRRVVVIGGYAKILGVYVPLDLGRYGASEIILAEARRRLRKVERLDRYRSEPK
jgi:hypothetical protein